MAISAGSDILASDFISTSSGSSDSGKGVKLNANGKLDDSFLKFGGNGSDGALTIAAAATTQIDAAGANIVVKNYSSINIANTGTLEIINKATNGTILILRCQGDCTIEGLIDLSSDGANAATNGFSILDVTADHDGNIGSNGVDGSGGSGASGGTILGLTDFYTTVDTLRLYSRAIKIACGSGGGKGGNGNVSGTGGVGGVGGGCVIIEVGGALDFDAGGEIRVDGGTGVVGGNGSNGGGGGGGGGTAGMALIIYNTLTDNSGTINAKGGAGGAGGDGASSGTSAYTGGGGGGGGGSITATGKTGGTGGTNSNNGSAGTNTNDAGGAGGGGGGGGAGTGGAGGTQGATDTNHYAVVENKFL